MELKNLLYVLMTFFISTVWTITHGLLSMDNMEATVSFHKLVLCGTKVVKYLTAWAWRKRLYCEFILFQFMETRICMPYVLLGFDVLWWWHCVDLTTLNIKRMQFISKIVWFWKLFLWDIRVIRKVRQTQHQNPEFSHTQREIKKKTSKKVH